MVKISKKIKIKAYQTDRAQTGKHQTNREKRWESHPDNFQFAFRRDCNDVEAALILQVGHLNPLKATGGHNATNIGWISDDGNRIQGSLSIDEVKALLRRIYRNRPELCSMDLAIQTDATDVVIHTETKRSS